MEETVKEKVKEKVEEKVVEEKAVEAGQWLRVFWGAMEAGSIEDLPWDHAVLASPDPTNLNQPLLVPPKSSIWTLRFFDAPCASQNFGAREGGMGGRGGGQPGRSLAGGRCCTGLVVATGVA